MTARAFTPDGAASPPRAATFRRTNYRDAVEVADAVPGLRLDYVEASLRTTASLDTLRPLRSTVAAAIGRPSEARAEGYALVFEGLITVPSAALYEFGLASDDGSTLRIGETMVVDNDGLHGSEERTGMVALRAGAHPITVRYFQAGGGAELRLRVRPAGGEWQSVPASWLTHQP